MISQFFGLYSSCKNESKNVSVTTKQMKIKSHTFTKSIGTRSLAKLRLSSIQHCRSIIQTAALK